MGELCLLVLKKAYMKRIEIDTVEAINLWKQGWCWRALGLRYKCHRATVKARCGLLRVSEAVESHCRNHHHCPTCYSRNSNPTLF